MQDNRRQSLRVPLPVPLIVSDPKPHGFSEYCEIVMANGHGCQLRSPYPLETGMQVRLDTVYVKNRVASATVIHSEPIGLQETRVWNCGLALDTPGNFWGIPSPPQDWPAADYSGANGIASFPPSPSERHQAPMHAGPPHGLDRSPQDWQQMLSAIDVRIAGLEARVENAAAEFEAAALARLQQSFGETVRQACEQIKRYAVACGESRLGELEAELERKMEPFMSRSQMTLSDLEQLLASIIRQQQGLRAPTSQARAHDYSQV